MSLAHQIKPGAEDAVREKVPEVGVTWHEYSQIFPWIEGPAFADLKADIAKNGVIEPIVFLDGAILDGRNRYTAARELGIEYPRVEYQGDDPLGFVISANLKRRHLTESQRAMVAKRMETFKHGDNQHSGGDANLHVRRDDASRMLSVSPRSIATASKVIETGAPELVAAVDAGKVSVSAAATIAKQDHDTQRRLVAEDKLKRAAADLKKAETEAKEAEKLPKAEPLTEEQKAEHRRVFGTQEDRAVSAAIDEIVERVAHQPAPADAVRCIPPALHHSVDTASIRSAAAWLIAFCEIWEQEKANGLEAAE